MKVIISSEVRYVGEPFAEDEDVWLRLRPSLLIVLVLATFYGG